MKKKCFMIISNNVAMKKNVYDHFKHLYYEKKVYNFEHWGYFQKTLTCPSPVVDVDGLSAVFPRIVLYGHQVAVCLGGKVARQSQHVSMAVADGRHYLMHDKKKI